MIKKLLKTQYMKVSELRIGNFIINQWGEKDFVEQIGISLVQFKDGYCRETEIKPIPLDDEIMELLGFTSKWTKGVFGVATTSEHSDYVFYQECEENVIAYFPKPLKYVHELQNMYYALTGEELTINEI